MLSVFWSKRAISGYKKVVDYLMENFSEKEISVFEEQIDSLITNISKGIIICKLSKVMQIHKCVTHKNTSLLYTIDRDKLRIVAIINNHIPNRY